MTGQKPPRVVPLGPRPLPVDETWAAVATAPQPALAAPDPAEAWAQHPTEPIAIDTTAALDDDDGGAREDDARKPEG